jgi:hypothetical protein
MMSTTNTNTNATAVTRALAVRDLLTGAVARRESLDDMFVNENQEQVVIDNPDLFEVLETAPEEELEVYSAWNGVLLKDDVPVTEKSQIYVEKILKAAAGKLLLLTGGSDDDRKLTMYTPSEGTFKRLFSLSRNYTVSECYDGRLVVLDTPCKVEEVDSTTNKITWSSRLIYFSKEMQFKKIKLHLPADAPAEGIWFARNRILVLSYRSGREELESKTRIGGWYADSTFFIEEIKNGKSLGVSSFEDWEADGLDSIVSITESLDGNLLIKTNNVIYYTNDGYYRIIDDPIVAETGGFDRFVAISFARRAFTLTLANEKRETVKITSRRTRHETVVSVE